jgi:hypothetical protein
MLSACDQRSPDSLRQGDWKEVKKAQRLFRVGDESGKLQRLRAQRIISNDGSDAWNYDTQPLHIKAHGFSIGIHPDPAATSLDVTFLVDYEHGEVFELAEL